MATEQYLVTMKELSRDYIALRKEWRNDLSNFTFNDYCKNYFTFLDSEEAGGYTPVDDDLDFEDAEDEDSFSSADEE